MDLHNECFKSMLLNNISPDILSDVLYYRYKEFETINKECERILGKYYFQLTKKDFDKFDWNFISKHLKLSEIFISTFQNKVNWPIISIHQELSEPFIKKYQNHVNWDLISIYQELSESFIREFQNKVNWESISAYQTLSEPFIREFQNRVDWENISAYQTLSEDFIQEFQDRVNWTLIFKYQELSEDFVKEYEILDDPRLRLRLRRQYPSGDFIRKYIKNYVNISFLKMLEPRTPEYFNRIFNDEFEFKLIPENQTLSEDFIDRFERIIHHE